MRFSNNVADIYGGRYAQFICYNPTQFNKVVHVKVHIKVQQQNAR